jgi:hypothetical protein
MIPFKAIYDAGRYRVYFDFHSPNGVLTAGLFQGFDVPHPYVRAQLYFSHEEADVLDLHLKGVCDTR